MVSGNRYTVNNCNCLGSEDGRAVSVRHRLPAPDSRAHEPGVFVFRTGNNRWAGSRHIAAAVWQQDSLLAVFAVAGIPHSAVVLANEIGIVVFVL